MGRRGYVYMMMNSGNAVIYTGVTSNLKKRIAEHRSKLVGGFTKRYKVTKLVYYEIYNEIVEAIAREKQIKGGSRRKKLELIQASNPQFEDLYEKI